MKIHQTIEEKKQQIQAEKHLTYKEQKKQKQISNVLQNKIIDRNQKTEIIVNALKKVQGCSESASTHQNFREGNEVVEDL